MTVRWIRETKRCRHHGKRPEVCRGFPFYGNVPKRYPCTRLCVAI